MGPRPTPVEPAPCRWTLPDPDAADPQGLCGVGADLDPGTLLAAYRSGLFPMRLGRHGPIGWWSPDPRGILPLDALHVSRSLRRSRRRLEIRVDTAFEAVMRGCADQRRPNGWIDDDFVVAYVRLFELGWARSVETYDDDGVLVGGLYGLRIGRFFAGESMFHLVPDASKAALWATVDLLRAEGATLFDVQWTSPHLCSMGAVDVSRSRYLELLAAAVS